MNFVSKKKKNYFQNDVLMQDTLIATKWLSLMFPFNMCDINIFRCNVRPLGISGEPIKTMFLAIYRCLFFGYCLRMLSVQCECCFFFFELALFLLETDSLIYFLFKMKNNT